MKPNTDHLKFTQDVILGIYIPGNELTNPIFSNKVIYFTLVNIPDMIVNLLPLTQTYLFTGILLGTELYNIVY